jgi:hypothetical protein
VKTSMLVLKVFEIAFLMSGAFFSLRQEFGPATFCLALAIYLRLGGIETKLRREG